MSLENVTNHEPISIKTRCVLKKRFGLTKIVEYMSHSTKNNLRDTQTSNINPSVLDTHDLAVDMRRYQGAWLSTKQHSSHAEAHFSESRKSLVNVLKAIKTATRLPKSVKYQNQSHLCSASDTFAVDKATSSNSNGSYCCSGVQSTSTTGS